MLLWVIPLLGQSMKALWNHMRRTIVWTTPRQNNTSSFGKYIVFSLHPAPGPRGKGPHHGLCSLLQPHPSQLSLPTLCGPAIPPSFNLQRLLPSKSSLSCPSRPLRGHLLSDFRSRFKCCFHKKAVPCPHMSRVALPHFPTTVCITLHGTHFASLPHNLCRAGDTFYVLS